MMKWTVTAKTMALASLARWKTLMKQMFKREPGMLSPEDAERTGSGCRGIRKMKVRDPSPLKSGMG